MLVGFHSPMPPAHTGVADYAAALLPALQARGRVEPGVSKAEIHLYHLGNNQLHAEIYERALRTPGVAVLHDAVLQHFFLGRLPAAEYIREFVYNYGPWSEELACDLYSERARSAADPRYFRYPMLRRIAETSRAVIVHNPAAAATVKAHAPAARIYEIPHFYTAPRIDVRAVESFRRRMGATPQTLICGVFGHLRESKRLAAILRVFNRLRRKLDICLVVAGEFGSSDLERSLRIRLMEPGILKLPYLPAPEFWNCAAAVDVCINLRFPAAGETSGIAVHLMGLGKVVLLTAGPEVSRFPETACLRADSGEAEEDLLTAYLFWLAHHRAEAREIGLAAASYIHREHALDRVADLYWHVLEQVQAASSSAA